MDERRVKEHITKGDEKVTESPKAERLKQRVKQPTDDEATEPVLTATTLPLAKGTPVKVESAPKHAVKEPAQKTVSGKIAVRLTDLAFDSPGRLALGQ
jgi:hypothetical protein